MFTKIIVVFTPSVGASGGIIFLWNSAIFHGNLISTTKSAITVNCITTYNSESWTLVNVYGPCSDSDRVLFVQWLYDLHIPGNEHWLLIGDFNFIRSVDNRNKPGADMNDFSF